MTAPNDDTDIPSAFDLERQLVADLDVFGAEAWDDPALRSVLSAAWTKGVLFGIKVGSDIAKAEVAKLLAEERER